MGGVGLAVLNTTLCAQVTAEIWDHQQFVAVHGEPALETMIRPAIRASAAAAAAAAAGGGSYDAAAAAVLAATAPDAAAEADEWSPAPMVPQLGADMLWQRAEQKEVEEAGASGAADGVVGGDGDGGSADAKVDVADDVLSGLMQEVVGAQAVRVTCEKLPEAEVPFFVQMSGKGPAAGAATSSALLMRGETKQGSADAALREDENQEFVARVLENTVFNLMRDAVSETFDLREVPKTLVKID